MPTLLQRRIRTLEQAPGILAECLRGIEKEGLRITPDGDLARTAHPAALGSALTHPNITTDYAEALLELITDTQRNVSDLMHAINWVHRVAVAGLGDEIIWGTSMPPALPDEKDIDIAWYGTSNAGMLKHIYRRGLAYRYGKTMQCIAGVHYNFSFGPEFWELLNLPGTTAQDRQSAGYVALIRNFVRYSWLLMYLFGASPAVDRQFLRHRQTNLLELDEHTLYLPWATSLRMSDLGYQNKAQASLKPCYNNLSTFIEKLYQAVTTPWPEFEALGTKRNGEWIQLNGNQLQIENEYYSSIRPKRTTQAGERPLTALYEKGIQYVEVRCLDIDPFEPAGISESTARFIDAFLLFCALQDSPEFGAGGFCGESAENFRNVVTQGRKPGLELMHDGNAITLSRWADQLFEGIRACASILADQLQDPLYNDAVQQQYAKVLDPSQTPSARVLESLKLKQSTFKAFGLEISKSHTTHFRHAGLSDEEKAHAATLREKSLAEQARLEADDSVFFDDYVQQYLNALPPIGTGRQQA